MISEETLSQARELLRGCGAGWTLRQNPNMAEDFIAGMKDAEAELRRRGAMGLDLMRECVARPAELAAFLQSFAFPMSPQMRAMVYLVLRGGSIRRIQFDYAEAAKCELRVELSLPGDTVQAFDSKDVWDAEIFRHFCVMKLDDKPIIDGYYPLNIPGESPAATA